MAIQVQLRRGNETDNDALTGAQGELTFDTTNNQIRVHDGSTAGGHPIGSGLTSTSPNLLLTNTSTEDTDGGRESLFTFKGKQSGGELSTLAQIQASHDGTADDEKGDLIFRTNDGSDGTSPTEALRIDSEQNCGLGTDSPDVRLHVTDSQEQLTLSEGGSKGATFDYRSSTGNLNIATNGIDARANPQMTLDLNGRVMIGTTTEGSAEADTLTIAETGNAGMTIRSGSSNSGTIFFSDATSGAGEYAGVVQYNHSSNYMRFSTSGSERMRIDSDGNVGIGTSSPFGTASNRTVLSLNNTSDNRIGFGVSGTERQYFYGDSTNLSIINTQSGYVRFHTANTERMRIDSSGRMLIGKTSTAFHIAGSRFDSIGLTEITRASGPPLHLNRTSDDGSNTVFYKDGTTVGAIGTNGGDLYVVNQPLDGAGAGLRYNSGFPNILPCNGAGANRDNAIDLGGGVVRFDDVYATNGTIQTSDENEKQDIASLTSAEITAATAISKLFKTFKWKEKVAAKGDNARTHSGVIAQEVEKAMSDAGLDASNYAFWCSNTWWETETEVPAVEADKENNIEAANAYTRTDTYYTKDEAPKGATERNRKGIRYPELLSFIGAATEQRLTSIEARLTALEG